MEAHPTLDQLEVFVAVAETGGFSAAARRLNRSQSVVSYAIANLEAQLEVRLFERAGTRLPSLTEAGAVLLEDARRILTGLEGMRARAGGLKSGLEPELVLAVDATVPTQALARVLGAFGETFPTVGVRLNVGALGMVHDQIVRQEATLGIAGGQVTNMDARVVRARVGSTSMIPVAAPSHPLALAAPPVPIELVREQTQLVITDPTDYTRGRNFGVLSFRNWRMTDMGVKYALILAGLGWGGLPISTVSADLDAGRLVRLSIDAYPERAFTLIALHHVSRMPGPATAWMIDRFRLELAACSAVEPLPSASAI